MYDNIALNVIDTVLYFVAKTWQEAKQVSKLRLTDKIAVIHKTVPYKLQKKNCVLYEFKKFVDCLAHQICKIRLINICEM